MTNITKHLLDRVHTNHLAPDQDFASFYISGLVGRKVADEILPYRYWHLVQNEMITDLIRFNRYFYT